MEGRTKEVGLRKVLREDRSKMSRFWPSGFGTVKILETNFGQGQGRITFRIKKF